MSNNTSNEQRIIFDYIGHHQEYGKHPYVCHICGNDCDITGRFIFQGDKGGVWDGEHFEFPICTYCFYEELSNAMDKMDSVMLQKQIEKERRWEKHWDEYDPPC